MISILGHQGGWDEMALVAANRRAQAQLDREDDAAAGDDDQRDDTGSGGPVP